MAGGTCDVFDALQVMTEHLNPEIYSLLRLQDYWIELVDRTTFPANTGYEQTVMTIENVEPPTVVPTWNAIQPTSDVNTQGPCAAEYTDLTWGFDEKVYAPEVFDVQGPVFCKDEFTFDFLTDEFINGYVGQLEFVTRRIWSNRYQEHFLSLSDKYFAGDGTFYSGVYLAPGTAQATLPPVEATSQVTQDMLDYIANHLITIGATATQPDSKGYITIGPEGPVFPFLIGLQMSKLLTFQAGPQLPAYLWASAGMDGASELMKRIGATKILFNERHIPCMFPPRWTYDSVGGYTRVEPFLIVPASGKGTKAINNPLWETAPYEAAFFLNPYVMRSEVVEPEVNAGGLPFDPISYFGDWVFEVGGNRIFPNGGCYDPHFKFGRHYAEFRHGIRPIHPNFGVTVIFKRCIQAPFTVTCS